MPQKYGPSLSPPGTGMQVLGGTTSSLVDYSISNRTPVDRIGNFDEIIKQMKRTTSNPSTNPQTGSPIEKSLGDVKDWRGIGMKEMFQATRRQLSQLPKLDFSIVAMGTVGEITEDYPVSEYTRESGKVKAHTRGESNERNHEEIIYKELLQENKEGFTEEFQEKVIQLIGMIKSGNIQSEELIYTDLLQENKENFTDEFQAKVREVIESIKECNTEDYKVKGYYSERGKPPKRIWTRRHTREEGTSIKGRPRMRPLEQWELDRIERHRLERQFGKAKYSKEHWMGYDKDWFDQDFHHQIYIADNVDYSSEKYNIARGNNALKLLPFPFQNLARVVFYKNITDDPNSEVNANDIPTPYKKVGWKNTYKEVDAQISYTTKTIRIRAGGYNVPHSIRHEVGHAVYWWKVGRDDQQIYREIHKMRVWHLRRQGKVGKYQANDINEFFAVQFERFYGNNHEEMFPETIEFFTRLDKRFGGVNKL